MHVTKRKKPTCKTHLLCDLFLERVEPERVEGPVLAEVGEQGEGGAGTARRACRAVTLLCVTP